MRGNMVKNTTCLEKMLYSKKWNYMFRPLLAIFRFPQFFKKSLENCGRACRWKRSLFINTLITLVKNTTCLEKMCSKNETTCFGRYWPSSGFHNILRSLQNCVRACRWKRPLCINPLICNRNRIIRGLMYKDLFHQHAGTQFCRIFLKYCGNLKMANKGRNM